MLPRSARVDAEIAQAQPSEDDGGRHRDLDWHPTNVLFAAEEEFLAGNPLTFECLNGHGERRQLVDTTF